MQLVTTLLLLALLSQIAFASTSYPTNPQLAQSTIILSHQGITAYDPQTLKPRWFSLTALQTDAPTQAADKLLVGSSRGLYALDTGTGETLWRFAPGTRLFSPSVRGGMAYIAGIDGTLRNLMVNSGRLIWQQKISDGWIYPPAIIDGLLITGGQEGTVWAVEATTGELRWHYSVGQELVFRPVATASGLAIITTFEGKVFAIDSQSGQLRWQQQHPVASFSPVVSDNKIYLPGYDNQLRVVEINSGRLLWSRSLPGQSTAPPQIHSGRTLIVTHEGNYLLLDSNSGNTLDQGKVAANSLGALLLDDQPPLFFSQHRNISTTQPVLFRSSSK